LASQFTQGSTKKLDSGSADWLTISIDGADATDVLVQLQDKIFKHTSSKQQDPSAVELVQQLRVQMLGDPSEISDSSVEMLIRQQDYDILPRDYKIDWRIPVLGPINSIVRRVINDEIRRFLFPPLKRQSSLNRQFVDAIQELQEENQLLHLELSKLNKKIATQQSEQS